MTKKLSQYQPTNKKIKINTIQPTDILTPLQNTNYNENEIAKYLQENNRENSNKNRENSNKNRENSNKNRENSNKNRENINGICMSSKNISVCKDICKDRNRNSKDKDSKYSNKDNNTTNTNNTTDNTTINTTDITTNQQYIANQSTITINTTDITTNQQYIANQSTITSNTDIYDTRTINLNIINALIYNNHGNKDLDNTNNNTYLSNSISNNNIYLSNTDNTNIFNIHSVNNNDLRITRIKFKQDILNIDMDRDRDVVNVQDVGGEDIQDIILMCVRRHTQRRVEGAGGTQRDIQRLIDVIRQLTCNIRELRYFDVNPIIFKYGGYVKRLSDEELYLRMWGVFKVFERYKMSEYEIERLRVVMYRDIDILGDVSESSLSESSDVREKYDKEEGRYHNREENYKILKNVKKSYKNIQRLCDICMSEYKESDKCIILRCNHYFHYKCLKHWLLINSTCPYCRKGVE
ncbi:hypothetical protein LUQ84_002661 [Hamiltosporidium tvaerminnensis]|nr:hypothetical protein LUQ84_002661 [Hamiltosporidium tvaerminnensis]